MKNFLVDCGIILSVAIPLALFLWALCSMQKCARPGCGHNEEDHVAGADGGECIMCDCKELQ